MSSDKKHWEKPQLIILARGEPEENVLEGCKIINHHLGEYGLHQEGCDQGKDNCGACKARSGS